MSRILDHPIRISIEKDRIVATWTNDTAIWIGGYAAERDPTLEAVLIEDRKQALSNDFQDKNLLGHTVEIFEINDADPEKDDSNVYSTCRQLLRVTALLIPSGDYSALPPAGTMRMKQPTLKEFLQSRVERDLKIGGAVILGAFGESIVRSL